MDILDMALDMKNEELNTFALRHIRAFVLLGHVCEDSKCVLSKSYEVRSVFGQAVREAVFNTLRARSDNSRCAQMQSLLVGAMGRCTPLLQDATREEVAMIRESLQMQRERLEDAEARADLTESDRDRECISKRWDQYRMQSIMLHRIQCKPA